MMKRSNKPLIASIFSFALCLILTGCNALSMTNIIEEISPTVLLFVDRNEQGNLEQTVIIPPVRKENTQLLTTEVTFMKEARNEFNKNFYREMKSGQLRILMTTKQIATEGLLPILNTLVLDPEITNRLFVVIVEGDFIDYLNNQLKHKQEAPLEVYLYKMMSHYEHQGEFTVINLHNFMERYFSEYADPIAPIFKVTEHKLSYKGTALFQDDQMVSHTEELQEILFQFLTKKNTFRKIAPLPKLELSIGALFTNTQITVLPKPAVHIQLDLTGRLEEYHGERNLMDYKEATLLQQDIESYLEDELVAMTRKLQQLGIDPFRIGEKTMTPLQRPYTDEQWREVWKKIPIEAKVNLQLDSLGLMRTGTK